MSTFTALKCVFNEITLFMVSIESSLNIMQCSKCTHKRDILVLGSNLINPEATQTFPILDLLTFQNNLQLGKFYEIGLEMPKSC